MVQYTSSALTLHRKNPFRTYLEGISIIQYEIVAITVSSRQS